MGLPFPILPFLRGVIGGNFPFYSTLTSPRLIFLPLFFPLTRLNYSSPLNSSYSLLHLSLSRQGGSGGGGGWPTMLEERRWTTLKVMRGGDVVGSGVLEGVPTAYRGHAEVAGSALRRLGH